jgi:hypothetical protein
VKGLQCGIAQNVEGRRGFLPWVSCSLGRCLDGCAATCLVLRSWMTAISGGVTPPAKAQVRKLQGTPVVLLVQSAGHGRLPIGEATATDGFQRRQWGKVFARASGRSFIGLKRS